MNTDGGDSLLPVANDGSVVGSEAGQFENADKFMRHLMQHVNNALGPGAAALLDPRP